MEQGDFREVLEWLVDAGTRLEQVTDLVPGLVGKLDDAGIPIERAFVALVTLHPQDFSQNWVWAVGDEAPQPISFSHEQFLAATDTDRRYDPIRRLFDGEEEVRLRLADPTVEIRDVQVRLRDEGYTDYIALPLHYAGLWGGAIAWATRVPGGFSGDHLAFLHQLQPILGLALHAFARRRATRAILQTYLGAHAGHRVELGQIRLGDGTTIPAAIWFSDLRGFTNLSATRPLQEVLETLNEAFHVQVNAIEAQGGTVLKFIGDGLLAMFPADGDVPGACARALFAARSVQEQVAAASETRAKDGRPPIRLGIGLHQGDVLYGNIGCEHRMDFTVIGPSVNLSARIEGLCSKLDRAVLVSDAFAETLSVEFEDMGAHTLKGVPEAVGVFAAREMPPGGAP